MMFKNIKIVNPMMIRNKYVLMLRKLTLNMNLNLQLPLKIWKIFHQQTQKKKTVAFDKNRHFDIEQENLEKLNGLNNNGSEDNG